MQNPYKILKSKELNEFTHDFSHRFRRCLYDGITMYAPTGEEYITFSPRANTKKDVIDKYKEQIEMYCGALPSDYTIYWRMYPELRKWPRAFIIYSRLLVSIVNPRTDLVSGSVTPMDYLNHEQNKKRLEKP